MGTGGERLYLHGRDRRWRRPDLLGHHQPRIRSCTRSVAAKRTNHDSLRRHVPLVRLASLRQRCRAPPKPESDRCVRAHDRSLKHIRSNCRRPNGNLVTSRRAGAEPRLPRAESLRSPTSPFGEVVWDTRLIARERPDARRVRDLPVYDWHREELEPLVRASREARIGGGTAGRLRLRAGTKVLLPRAGSPSTFRSNLKRRNSSPGRVALQDMAPPSLSSPVRRGPGTNRGEGRSLGATFGYRVRSPTISSEPATLRSRACSRESG